MRQQRRLGRFTRIESATSDPSSQGFIKLMLVSMILACSVYVLVPLIREECKQKPDEVPPPDALRIHVWWPDNTDDDVDGIFLCPGDVYPITYVHKTGKTTCSLEYDDLGDSRSVRESPQGVPASPNVKEVNENHEDYRAHDLSPGDYHFSVFIYRHGFTEPPLEEVPVRVIVSVFLRKQGEMEMYRPFEARQVYLSRVKIEHPVVAFTIKPDGTVEPESIRVGEKILRGNPGQGAE